jgi:hypothetical protein
MTSTPRRWPATPRSSGVPPGAADATPDRQRGRIPGESQGSAARSRPRGSSARPAWREKRLRSPDRTAWCAVLTSEDISWPRDSGEFDEVIGYGMRGTACRDPGGPRRSNRAVGRTGTVGVRMTRYLFPARVATYFPQPDHAATIRRANDNNTGCSSGYSSMGRLAVAADATDSVRRTAMPGWRRSEPYPRI